jgi:hypothetical protein
MKAKDYAECYGKSSDPVYDLAKLIVKDIDDLVKQRKVKVNSAYKAVFKEVYNKFNVARKLNPLIPDYIFNISIKAVWPEIYSILVRDNVISFLTNEELVQTFYTGGANERNHW